MYKKKAGYKPGVILWVTFGLSLLLIITIIIPGILVRKIPHSAARPLPDLSVVRSGFTADESLMIPVYLSKKAVVESVPLEDYVKGVIAAEMPAEFELEALKAQAMAARTFIIQRIIDQDFSDVPSQDAWVTDTTTHQAYMSVKDLKNEWDSKTYAANMAKINRAVEETKDLVLTYEGKPIHATFFSTSNGFTENSEDYWPDKTPYLRSVPSPWDMKLSPRYQATVSLNYKTVLQKLGVSSISTVSNRSTGIQVLERSAGHRIKKMAIGGKTFSGREVREKLGLASSGFDWKWQGTQLVFTTYGYGHGVGLSQWGAEGMAKQGKTANEIVSYYYTGISITKAASLLAMK
jgi:stage II sporulation protein D